MLMLCLSASIAMADSTKENFDFDWKFTEGDVNGAETVSFNDKSWQSVDLPHDWDVYHAPKADAPTGNDGGYYPGGIGWYRKTFKAPNSDKVKLYFEGVYQKCRIYINGSLAGTHEYGYTPFYIDIKPFLKKGNNTVAIRIDNSVQPNCRWYSGSGIYRHVWLETSEKLYIEDNGVFVTTSDVSEKSAKVNVAVTLKNENSTSKSVKVSTKEASADVTLDAGESKTVNLTYTINNPKLWCPDSPVLYKADVSVTDGKRTIAHHSLNYGIRYFSYNAQEGFKLNGKSLLINGACVHHDDGVLGAMAFDAAEIRKVRLMKDAGFNLIRTSHNPTTRAFLDACDSIGMLVIDEMYDGWYTSKTRGDHHTALDSCYHEDIKALVTTDRNHPSVICWSIGNEVIERKEIRVIQTATKFKNEVLRWDASRPVTEALCAWDNDWEIYDPHAAVLDIVGYNYMMHKAASDHDRCPERVMWQTESYPREAFKNWARTFDNNYIIGDIVWTGLDYLGESGIGQFYYEGEPRGEHYIGKHFPFHGAYCGDVDMTGWRKPISHYRDMLWNDTEGKNIYLSVREPDYYKNGRVSETQWSVWPTWESWNWPGHEGKKIEAEIYTKAPVVKLYLNDRLVATKEVNRSTEYKAVIPLNYEAGTLRAVAVDVNGNEGESCSLVTAGEPASIRLTPERKTITADGEDLAYIVLEVLDKDGNIVPHKDISADISVTGAGRLLAAASASFKDLEPMTSSHVTTYNGRAVIVIRSMKKVGNIWVTVKSDLLQSSIKMRTR